MIKTALMAAYFVFVSAFGFNLTVAEDGVYTDCILRRGVNENGQKAWIQTITDDFDGDGQTETLSVYYIHEGDDVPLYDVLTGHDFYEVYFSMNDNGNVSRARYTGDNIRFPVKHASLDQTRTQFWIEENGSSADPRTYLYEYDGETIRRLLSFDGFIGKQNDKGGFDTTLSNPDWCYYDPHEGLIPVPLKKGETLSLDFNVLLFTEKGHYTEAILSPYYEENLDDYVRENDRAAFVKMVRAGETVNILAREFGPNVWNPEDGAYWYPWLYVETADGTRGWFSLVFGD